MPPQGRTPTVSRPRSGFDAPANSNIVSRMPWEREDDDEFGPPPALDVTPGGAESEAKRMIYEKTHPMHEALMQNAHLDHNRAMRRYTALARRAWDPAARDFPVKPARTVGDDGLARVSASAVRRPSTQPSSAYPLPSLEPRASTQTPRGPHKGLGKSSPRPRQVLEPEADVNPAQPPRPQDFGRRGANAAAIDNRILSHYRLSLEATEGRAQNRRNAMSSLSVAERGLSNPETPPHAINDRNFRDASRTVRDRDDLSMLEQYVYLRLFSYEDTIEGPNNSRGGILVGTLNGLRNLANELRSELGKPAITATLPSELTLDEIVDLQKVFMIRWLHADKILDRIAGISEESNDEELDQLSSFDPFFMFGSNEMAAQIADTMFLHGIEGATPILQRAINDTIRSLGISDRERLGIAGSIQEDREFGNQTRSMLEVLARDPEVASVFLLSLQIERAEAMIERTTTPEYEGFNIARIWGLAYVPH